MEAHDIRFDLLDERALRRAAGVDCDTGDRPVRVKAELGIVGRETLLPCSVAGGIDRRRCMTEEIQIDRVACVASKSLDLLPHPVRAQ
jgi:hypothetical protein